MEKESDDIFARDVALTYATEKAAAQAQALALVRRDVRTYNVKNAGISIKNLDYPGASKLFSPPKGANVRFNVFDSNSDKVADHKVKNLKTKPASYDGYVTEHIVEVEFLRNIYPDAKKKSFFATWWNKELDATAVAKRLNKPSITMGDQTTINSMVLEALGSNNNREDFVLCGEEINGYKARIWNKANPMAPTRYKRAVKDAGTGAIDSNVYLSALRITFAVFEHLNDPGVKSRLQASIKNVGIEPKNVGHLTKESWDLTKE
ncbi:hypothetical protein N0V95_005029 [Ascochyta clinopodiicola]|nr:hypothetical protein N0V95_005029 [Ascochyta clinopodiicola]